MARKKVDSAIDVFWSGMDWLAGAKDRLDKSRQESAARRSAESVGAEAPGAEPQVETKKIPIRLPKLRIFSRFRRAAGEPRAARMMACPACGHPTPPPALYCEACHEPFLHVSKALILALVTLAVSCFFAAEYFRKDMEWPWPIYIFYAACFLVIDAALLKGAPALAAASFFWGAAFLGGGLFVYYFGEGVAGDFVLDAVNTFGRFLAEQPIGLIAFASGILLSVVILFVWMSRRYTIVHSYRIIGLGLAAASLAGKFAFLRAVQYKPIADSFSFIDEDAAAQGLEMLGVNLLRAILAEIVVYSMVKAYKPASQAFAAKRARPRAKAAAARSPMDQLAESFYTLSITLANGATRFYLQVWHGAATLARELRDLARHGADFVWTLARDFVVPVASMTISAAAIYRLSVATGDYVVTHRALGLLPVAGAATAVFIGQLLFLASRCRIPPSRLLTSQLYLLLWFAPYALILFLFLSFSLYAVGLVLARWNSSLEYSYRMGAVTLAAFALLLAALAFAVMKRHREGAAGEAASTDASSGKD